MGYSQQRIMRTTDREVSGKMKTERRVQDRCEGVFMNPEEVWADGVMVTDR